MGVALFVSFWVLLGLTVFFLAIRGGPRGARESRQTQSPGARRAATVLAAVVYVGIGVAVPAVVIAADEGQERTGATGQELTAAQARGRELFLLSCQQCHTLAGAKAVGKTGPDLDELRPPRELVLDAIKVGRSRGSGRMPADLATGRDARDIADFVARVAGR